MLNDIKDSIKAKLYDFTYTPFMSSVFISWIILNHTYLLIYFSTFDLEKKLQKLENYDFACHFYGYTLPYAENVILPILFGLFYVFVYPLISKKFYEYTLKRTKELKGVKQLIEDETPLTQIEAREIRKLASILEEEKDKALESLRKKEDEYKIKLSERIEPLRTQLNTYEENSKLADSDIKKLKNELEDVKIKFNQSSKLLANKNDECEQLKANISEIEKIIPDIPTKKVIKAGAEESIEQTESYKKVMQYLHDEFDTTTESSLFNTIVNRTQIGTTVAKKIINTLIDKNILQNENGIIKITNDGVNEVIKYINDLNVEIPF